MSKNVMRKLRFGLIGGGEGAFIGNVHRMAAEMDGMAELVCGAFSRDAERSIRSGTTLYRLDAQRCYRSYTEMFAAEAQRDEQANATGPMDFVIIAAPNNVHYAAACAALEAGFHVVCDKPLTVTLAEALDLKARCDASGLKFAVTHNYTGYPMIREARALIESGALGAIRRVNCEYLQGWLATDAGDNKQAQWRTDPQQAGAAGCFGDIGSHAHNLVDYVTGLKIAALCADLTTFVPGRELDDDGNVLLRFEQGARGIISASQIAVGKENDLCLQVYGELGGIEWRQAEANSLIVRWADKPYEVRRSGWAGTGSVSQGATRLPPGHPEGYLEAFAEIYRNFCEDLLGGEIPAGAYPQLTAGINGMQFIQQVVASSAAGGQWVDFSIS